VHLCFDIEVKWQEGFRYGVPRSYESAWGTIAELGVVIVGATAYIAGEDRWVSFTRGEIPKLCEMVAAADKVITFNGKLWDVPVIG
jgi:hypothetical protein